MRMIAIAMRRCDAGCVLFLRDFMQVLAKNARMCNGDYHFVSGGEIP